MAVARSKKILIGEEEAKVFMGFSSRQVFERFIKAGLPHLFDNGRYYFHTEAIEEWFKGCMAQNTTGEIEEEKK